MLRLLLYLLLIAAFFITVFRRNHALSYVAVFIMPLTESLPAPWGLFLAPLNIMLIGFVALRMRTRAGLRETSDRLPLRFPIWFLIVALLIGLLIRVVSQLSGGIWLMPLPNAIKNVWYSMLPFVFYGLFYRFATPPLKLDWLVAACQGSMALEAFVATYERTRGSARSSAHIGEDNEAGCYFAAAASFFLGWFLSETRPRRWVYLGGVVLSICGLFATLSRGGLLAAGAGVLFVTVTFVLGAEHRTATKVWVIAAALILTLNLPLILPESVKARIAETFRGSDPASVSASTVEEDLDISASERIIFWEYAVKLVRENPFGYGAFTFPQMLWERVGIPKVAHNIYLSFFVEFGMQGLAALLTLVFAVFFRLFRVYRNDRSGSGGALALALIGFWTAHVTAHVFLNSFLSMVISGQFWVLMSRLDQSRASVPTSTLRKTYVARRGGSSRTDLTLTTL